MILVCMCVWVWLMIVLDHFDFRLSHASMLIWVYVVNIRCGRRERKSQIFRFLNINAAWPHTVHYLDDARNQNHLTYTWKEDQIKTKKKIHCNASANPHRNTESNEMVCVRVYFYAFSFLLHSFCMVWQAQQKTKLWT